MARGKLLVFNEPKSQEVEVEYNSWYDGDHVPQILEHVPAITGAKRLRILPGQDFPLLGQPRYLALYEIEADDLMEAVRQLGAAVEDGRVVMTDSIRSDPRSTYVVYEEL